MHTCRMVDLGGQLLTLIIGLRLRAASAGKRVMFSEVSAGLRMMVGRCRIICLRLMRGNF
jgi:hypothetical protein